MNRYRKTVGEGDPLPLEDTSFSRIVLRSLFWSIPLGLIGFFVALMITYLLLRVFMSRVTPVLRDIIISQDLYSDWLEISSFLQKIPHHYIFYLFIGVIILILILSLLIMGIEVKRETLALRDKALTKSSRAAFEAFASIFIPLSMGIGIPLLFLSPLGRGLFENGIQLFAGLGFEEMNLKVWMHIGLGLIAVFSIPGAIGGMLFSGISFKRKNYLAYLFIPSLLAILFIGGCLSFYHLVTTKYHFGEHFWERLNIPVLSEDRKRYILLFMEEDRPPKIEEIKADFKVTPFEKRIFPRVPFQTEPPAKGKLTIDASLEYVLKAHDYLKEKDYQVWSFFEELFAYVDEGYEKSLSLKEMSQFQFEAFKNSNYIIGMITLVHNLSRFAQFDQEFLDLIDSLADETLFHHGKIGSRGLGDAYLHFGEHEKARYWYDKAKRLGYESKERPIPEIDLAKPFFKEGKIQGKILIDGKGYQGVKIGLVRPPEKEEEITFNSHPSPIVASTATDKEGRFSFDNILEGEYYLAIMTDRHLGSDERIGKFSLSYEIPAVNLGVIRIHSL